MNDTNNRVTQGVGYARVSLEKQNAEGDLERQIEKLRAASQDRGIELVSIHTDVVTGEGMDVARRPGLMDAIKQATELQLPLVVTDITRATREPERLLELLERLGRSIMSLDGLDLADPAEHLRRVTEGKELLSKIRSGTKHAMATKKVPDVLIGSPGDSQTAAKASARARKFRAADVIEKIADVLAENPIHVKLRRQDFADLLNDRRIHSGWRRSWTAASVRLPRLKAINELEERMTLQSEIDAEPEESFKKPSDPVSPQFAAALEGAKTFRKSAPPALVTEPAAEADDAAMRRDPNFARF